jgi:hypothetical protein
LTIDEILRLVLLKKTVVYLVLKPVFAWLQPYKRYVKGSFAFHVRVLPKGRQM